jgi:(p)ppGpp synthase/HD superfamily hydrolase
MHLSERYSRALMLAFELHRMQERAGSGVPYVAHLLGVSSLALEYGADEDAAIAALLHDAVEDQGGAATLARIRSEFGPKVAAIVEACTDSMDAVKPPWRERKLRYLAHLRAAPPEAQLVAACDKLYNLRTIVADYRVVGEQLWSRFTGKREGVHWYYRSLVEALTLQSAVVDELKRTVTELEGLIGAAPAAATP